MSGWGWKRHQPSQAVETGATGGGPSLQHDAHVGKQWDGPQGGAASPPRASNRALSFSGKSGAQGFVCADHDDAWARSRKTTTHRPITWQRNLRGWCRPTQQPGPNPGNFEKPADSKNYLMVPARQCALWFGQVPSINHGPPLALAGPGFHRFWPSAVNPVVAGRFARPRSAKSGCPSGPAADAGRTEGGKALPAQEARGRVQASLRCVWAQLSTLLACTVCSY